MAFSWFQASTDVSGLALRGAHRWGYVLSHMGGQRLFKDSRQRFFVLLDHYMCYFDSHAPEVSFSFCTPVGGRYRRNTEVVLMYLCCGVPASLLLGREQRWVEFTCMFVSSTTLEIREKLGHEQSRQYC